MACFYQKGLEQAFFHELRCLVTFGWAIVGAILPKPLQQPRIPIWVGGIWPNKAPFRRAAKWDGAFPLFEVEENEEELAQLEDMVRYLGKCRKHEQPIDIILMGVTPDAESEEAVDLVEQRSELGATWWLEC